MSPNELLAQAEQNSAKPDESTPEKEAARESFLRELGNSMIYAAVEAPAMGVAQYISNDAMNNVKTFFTGIGIEAPGHSKMGTSTWYAQTVGGAVGMILPFAATKYGLGKVGAFGKPAAAAGEAGYLSQRSAIGLSLKESAITGGVYGAAFTPSDEKARSAGFTAFLSDRAISAGGGAATFTVLTAGSLGMGALGKNATVQRFGIAPVINNPIFSGAVSGLPGGFVSAEYEALARQGRPATSEELAESLLAMGVVGGTFGGASYLARLRANQAAKDGKPVEQEAGRNSNVEQTAAATEGTGNPNRVANPNERVAANERTVGETLVIDPLPIESRAARRAGEPPKEINPNEFRPTSDQTARATLTEAEQQLWRDIQEVKTGEQWKQLTERIDEVPSLSTGGWLGDVMERRIANLSNAEMNTLWPQLLQGGTEASIHAGYKLAQNIGKERATELWQHQLESVKKVENQGLAYELARTIGLIEPSKQIQALNELMDLPNPPSYVNMAPIHVAKANQFEAAKLLAEKKGIAPVIENGYVPASKWTEWALSMEPGSLVRDRVLEQASKRGIGSANTPEALNDVFKVVQQRMADSNISFREYDRFFNSALTAATKDMNTADGIAYRTAALKDIDPKLIGRLMFSEGNWAKADRIAAENPELMRALAINSKFTANKARNDYISEIMTREPPVTADQLTASLMEKARQVQEGKPDAGVSPGDIAALMQHGVKFTPEQATGLLKSVQAEVLKAMDLEGTAPIMRERLLTNLTLAHEIGKKNPEAYEQVFRQPIDAKLTDGEVSYQRRLEATQQIGDLQRRGYEGARAMGMPELRQGKIVDLPPHEQAQYRGIAENALRNVEQLRQAIGDGPLGRLFPKQFGHAHEGGIVGRNQHSAHDFKLDGHLLSAVEKLLQDPEYKKLSAKDKINAAWATFLHDVGKKENMVDFDHNRSSVSMAWGILRSLGYPDTRIQRITDIMSKDAELSFNPDVKNSVTLQRPGELDNVVNHYRHPDGLRMVGMLNRADIKSVKQNEGWWKPEVKEELDAIHALAAPRVEALNRHSLPILTTELPQGFGGHVMSKYGVYGHSTYDLAGTFLKQRPTIESPEFSMSVSLLTPGNHKVYTEGAQHVALISGNYENISQANRTNLSTGVSVGWEGHVKLVENWATDRRARDLAQEAETRLAQIDIPAAHGVPEANFPRLNFLRQVLSEYDGINELRQVVRREEAAGRDPGGVGQRIIQAAESLTNMMTTEKDGTPLARNNEIKLNNPIISGIGLLRRGTQPVFFEGMTPAELAQFYNGNVPSFVSSGAIGTAPSGALVVKPDMVTAAKKNNLPIVILNDAGAN
ncbi:MAG: hypothetical protein C0507_00640 [Cyanobacteria bacterium PR.3.49]|nr:hypothetical protein [Cyanobacteria bacterium PR.3.49]